MAAAPSELSGSAPAAAAGRILYVVRHAQAEAAAAGQLDRHRPLTAHGRGQAAALAAAVAGGQLAGRPVPVPQLVLASAAVRAEQTARPLAEATGAELWVEPGLYRAGVDDVVELVRLVGAEPAVVAVVGHNPTVEQLVVELAGLAAARQALLGGLGTAAVVVLALPVGSWSQLAPGEAQLLVATRP